MKPYLYNKGGINDMLEKYYSEDVISESASSWLCVGSTFNMWS